MSANKVRGFASKGHEAAKECLQPHPLEEKRFPHWTALKHPRKHIANGHSSHLAPGTTYIRMVRTSDSTFPIL